MFTTFGRRAAAAKAANEYFCCCHFVRQFYHFPGGEGEVMVGRKQQLFNFIFKTHFGKIKR